MNIFEHKQSAHCENGVTVNLLRHIGIDYITEPLAFGLGSGLFYIHIPFITISNGPAISFRTLPGAIFNRTCKALKIKVYREKFKSKEKASDKLDQLISEGTPVGCQVGVFHLNYFPKEYRFHFNAHNIVVYNKQNNNYLISDPVMESTTLLTREDLEKVRFAQGALAPKGQIYYPMSYQPITKEELISAAYKSIKQNSRNMLYVPGGIAGVDGIKYTAKQIKKWREKLGEKKAALYLGQIVRMQEEIGTGGGGFRFIYAAFLEEIAALTNNNQFSKLSDELTTCGDLWRDSAVNMSGIFKGRLNSQNDYLQCANLLYEISEKEKQVFTKLLSTVKKL